MRSAVEARFYQGIIDSVEADWIPDIYYTITPENRIPSSKVSNDMMEACEPFLGEQMSELNRLRLQAKMDEIVHGCTARREILIWVSLTGYPLLIDKVRVVASTPYSYSIRPIFDRTDIMREMMENLEAHNG
jgi:hypothetical protein